MKRTQNRARPAAGRRRSSRKKTQALSGPRQFLLRTFYYLKAEQLISTSNRLLCEAQ